MLLCSIHVKTTLIVVRIVDICTQHYTILGFRLPFQMEGKPRLGIVNHDCRVLLFLELWPPFDGVNNDLLGRYAAPPSYCELKILSYRLIMSNEQCSC